MSRTCRLQGAGTQQLVKTSALDEAVVVLPEGTEVLPIDLENTKWEV